MQSNVCIFTKIVHVASGKEIDPGLLQEGTYIEALSLDSPKLMLVLRDHGSYLQNQLRLQEFDELSISLGDTWREDGVSSQETFVVLTSRPMPDGTVRLNCLAKPIFDMKKIADRTRVFTQRGVQEIAAAFAGGLKRSIGQFAVVENYHCIAGERPTTMLRQLAEEQGAHAWVARGTFHLRKFAEILAQDPAMTFHYATMDSGFPILKYTRPSTQMHLQESAIRSFTGWNETLGRVKTSSSIPFLAGAKSTPPMITGAAAPYVLGNKPVTKQTAIDFVTLGNLSITPGQLAKLVWHLPDPENPIDEGLPERVVIESVAHWYSSQKYYCRVKGAVALEPR